MIGFLQKTRLPVLPPVILRGERVQLRPPQAEDYVQWAHVRAANAARLKAFEPRWAEGSLSEEFYARRLERQANDWMTDRNYAFLILWEESLIGGININNVCRGAAYFASLGYWIDAGYEGKGFMREAIETLMVYAFDHLRLHRINAATLPENIRSQKLLERLGFVQEGFAKEYLQIDGIWRDHILFGKWQDTKTKEDENVIGDH